MTAYDFVVAEEGDGSLDVDELYADKNPNPDVLMTDGGLGIEGYTQAESTFRSVDVQDPHAPDRTRLHVENDRMEGQRWRDYHRFQHGGGSIPTETGLDEVEEGLRIDPKTRDVAREVRTVLTNVGFRDDVVDRAVEETLSTGGRSLSFVGGNDALALASGLAIQFGSEEDARSSGIWDDWVEMCGELDLDVTEICDRAFE